MKKRLFSYLLAAALLLTLVPVGARAADFLYGDVNGDGKINAKDATLILRYAVGKLTDLSEYDWEAANVNADDRVNAKDATLILRYSVHKLDKFPAESHEHSYEAVVTQPTCTEGGYTTYTCSCGDSYTGDETEATGHNYKTETVAPTTEAEGYDLHTCTVCGYSYKDNYMDKLPEETEPNEPTVEDYLSDSHYAEAVVAKINEYRAAANLNSLTFEYDEFALLRAAELRVSYSHTRPNGGYIYEYDWSSECIAAGYSSAESVATAWYNSSGHNPSIMKASYKYATAAYNGSYWVILLC